MQYLQIVSKTLTEPIRSHKDMDKGAVPFFDKAVKFYEGLSKQLVHQGHVLDLFACALDQVCSLPPTFSFSHFYSFNVLLYRLTLSMPFAKGTDIS